MFDSKFILHTVGTCFVLLAANACQSVTPSPDIAEITFLPTFTPDGAITTYAEGRLEVRNGCLLLRHSSGDYFYLIWPEGTTISKNRAVVFPEQLGLSSVSLGDRVRLAGNSQVSEEQYSTNAKKYREECPGELFAVESVEK